MTNTPVGVVPLRIMVAWLFRVLLKSVSLEFCLNTQVILQSHLPDLIPLAFRPLPYN
jgi:hypothetical protein